MLSLIWAVHEGNKPTEGCIMTRSQLPIPPSFTSLKQLSHREREVIEWTGKGKTASEVGLILTISEHTVAQHLKAIRRKLASSNNAHAVLMAIRTGQFGN